MTSVKAIHLVKIFLSYIFAGVSNIKIQNLTKVELPRNLKAKQQLECNNSLLILYSMPHLRSVNKIYSVNKSIVIGVICSANERKSLLPN